MKKYTLICGILLVFNFSTFAQQGILTGSLKTASGSSVISNIASTKEHYYFVTLNQSEGKRPISIFKTTYNFEPVDVLDRLFIRDAEAEYMSFFQIFSDKILMVSNAETENGNFLYTHILDLDLNSHTILDSIPINLGEEFTAFDYKILNDSTIFSIGNISTSNTSVYLSTDYIEFDVNGVINRFESIKDHRSPVLTFDYNQETDTYFIGELSFLNLVNSNFEVITRSNGILPIPVNNSPDIVLNVSSCNFVDTNILECIASSIGPAGIYSNFAANYTTNEDTIVFQSATPLHAANVENDRTRIVQTTEDSLGNRYFAYYEPFNPVDFEVIPNKVFISKFDKDLNNIYFLELLDSQEHGFEDIHVDQQGNLIVAGATLTPELGVFNNAYIKISENGELLTSTGSISLPETIDIYPNPTSDFINLNIDQPTTDINYFIYTLDGRQKAHGTISFGGSLSLNTQELPAGMYILHAEYNGRIRVAKFIKK